MLALHLAPIFKARGIDNPTAFLKRAGFTAHVASNLANNKTITLNLKQVETLCIVLFCEPNDLFSFTADPKHILADDHPMLNFSNQETIKKNFKDIFSTMSFKQLKEMTQALTDKTNL